VSACTAGTGVALTVSEIRSALPATGQVVMSPVAGFVIQATSEPVYVEALAKFVHPNEQVTGHVTELWVVRQRAAIGECAVAAEPVHRV